MHAINHHYCDHLKFPWFSMLVLNVIIIWQQDKICKKYFTHLQELTPYYPPLWFPFRGLRTQRAHHGKKLNWEITPVLVYTYILFIDIIYKYINDIPLLLSVYVLPGLQSRTILHLVGPHDLNEYHMNLIGKNEL